MAKILAVTGFVLIGILAVYFEMFGLRDALGMYWRKGKPPQNPDDQSAE